MTYAGLLRNIVGEVIRRCQESIDVDAIWNGDVEAPMECLTAAIECGHALNKLFRQTCAIIEADPRCPCNWNFADGAVFAEVGE